MDLSDGLKKFTQDTGLPLKKLKEITGVRADQIMEWWAQDVPIFDESHLKKMELFLGIPGDRMIDQTFDRQTARRRILGPNVSICDHYADEARSFVRSSSHIIKYLRLLHGQHKMDRILMEMNVHPAYFDNHDNQINIQFFIDVLDICYKLGFKPKDIRNVASSMFLSIEGSESQKMFPRCETYEEVYSNVRNIVHSFDTNFYYDLKVRSDGMEMTAEPQEPILKILRRNKTNLLFFYRREVFSAVPLLCGMPYLPLKMEQSGPEEFMKFTYSARFPLSASTKLRLI